MNFRGAATGFYSVYRTKSRISGLKKRSHAEVWGTQLEASNQNSSYDAISLVTLKLVASIPTKPGRSLVNNQIEFRLCDVANSACVFPADLRPQFSSSDGAARRSNEVL
jgi:hypothetical protein